MSHCKHYLWASTEMFVDWRKQKISDLMMFFAEFWSFYDCLHKNDDCFKELFTCFSLTTTWSRAQANHKGVEKYIFHCFGKWVLSKIRLWKINQMLWQSCGASLYILVYTDLLASSSASNKSKLKVYNFGLQILKSQRPTLYWCDACCVLV